MIPHPSHNVPPTGVVVVDPAVVFPGEVALFVEVVVFGIWNPPGGMKKLFPARH